MSKSRKVKKSSDGSIKKQEQQFYKVAIGVTFIVLVILYFVFKNAIG